MRSAALVALLPALVGVATAAPQSAARDTPATTTGARRSLSFGPHHAHHRFETDPELASTFIAPRDASPRKIASQFIASKIGAHEGQGFYIRDDSYTDPRTLVTHVYARQLINGLEVSDGDINVNVDRNGRVLSWGNSFAPNTDGSSFIYTHVDRAREHRKACKAVEDALDAHREALEAAAPFEGAWGLVKAAAKSWFPMLVDDESGEDPELIRRNLEKVQHHFDAMCTAPLAKASDAMEPASALAVLLQRISPDLTAVNPDDIESSIKHDFKPKPAHAEPPTMILSGKALQAADVVGDVPTRVMFTQTSSGIPRIVYKFEVEMKDNWYEAYVDTVSGEIIRIVDWAADFTPHDHQHFGKGDKQKPLPVPKTEPEYFVFPWGVNDPQEGKPKLVSKPYDSVASPLGWHTFPTEAHPWPQTKFPGSTHAKGHTTVSSTVGNNVVAHEDWEGRNAFLENYRPSNESMSFVYDYGEPDGLAPREYIDFVVTQLFYTCNMYHDLLYRLGFDEVSGNFQMTNFDKGGRGSDPVIANAQDGSGYNNANFMTPPDGQAPRMRMYVWDTASPYRDGDLEAGIVIHEYSHGLSTRLTGGPANSGCLGWGEAGGMGEGWGDAIATIIRQVVEHKKYENGTDVFPMGAWAANQESGIRNYVYSTNSTSNPSSYKTLDKPGYWGVHAIGEVWAEFLFVLTQSMIEKYGFSTTLFPPEDTSKPNDYYTKTSGEAVDAYGRAEPLVPKHGNTLALQLIISAMKLQPCRPTFFDARKAIIAADEVLTEGANKCLIWSAFAERGLGIDARIDGQTPWGGGVRADGFKLPSECK